MINIFNKNKNGQVLVFALWIIIFLTVIATTVGLRVRQRAELLSRIESKSKLRHLAEAGVKLSIASLRQDLIKNEFNYIPFSKYYRHNNPNLFKSIKLADGEVNVSYKDFDYSSNSFNNKYGYVDEERKININYAEKNLLKRLFTLLLNIDEQQIDAIVDAAIDWRTFGKSSLDGFYSDDYYSNLEYPYGVKDSDFELLAELLLVKGVDRATFERIEPYITVYGDGLININTVSRTVLIALGLSDSLADKIISVRSGIDSADFTADDFIFSKTYDIAIEMGQFVELTNEERKQIDLLNAARILKTNSFYYLITSTARLEKNYFMTIDLVYNAAKNKIEYYVEK